MIDDQRSDNGKENNCWHEMALYRTAGGSHVLSIVFRSLAADVFAKLGSDYAEVIG